MSRNAVKALVIIEIMSTEDRTRGVCGFVLVMEKYSGQTVRDSRLKQGPRSRGTSAHIDGTRERERERAGARLDLEIWTCVG